MEWFAKWRHTFKLDPDRSIDDASLARICQSGTDAIIVGGSSGVDYDNTADLLHRIRSYEVDCVLEVSSLELAVPGFDGYFVPMVLNSASVDWMIGKHVAGTELYGDFIPWHQVAAEGYIVLNDQSTVGRLTEASCDLEADRILAYGRVADRLLRLPIVYIEYSGSFGDMDKLSQVKRTMSQARVFYGGGIDSVERAREAAAVAHTIVVGNIIYTDLEAALATVQASKEESDDVDASWH